MLKLPIVSIADASDGLNRAGAKDEPQPISGSGNYKRKRHSRDVPRKTGPDQPREIEVNKFLATTAVALALACASTQANASYNICAFESSPTGWFAAWYCDSNGTVQSTCSESNNANFPTYGQDRADYYAAFISHRNAYFGTNAGNTCAWFYTDNN